MTRLEQMLEKSSKVGVVGMGGIGKTTLVKEFYRQRGKDFDASCILYDVYKEKDVLMLQRKLLQKIVTDGQYNDSNPPDDKEVGKVLLQSFLSKRRVLIVLDDVGEDSIDYLIPEGAQVHKDSKVILTYRGSFGLRRKVFEELEMQFLGSLEAKELFCMHAFKEKSCPNKTLENVTNDIVNTCGGLPLSLEVVGSYLSEMQGHLFWSGVLSRLRKAESLDGSAEDKLWAKLKISFDALAPAEKGVFLDIACYFCSESCKYVAKDMALAIWGSVEDSSMVLKNLIDRHLISVNELGLFTVHDQLVALGRNILRTEPAYKHTRASDECEGLSFEVQLSHDFIL